MKIFVLWLLLAGQQPLDLGEYLTEGRCEVAAALQLPYWRKVYGERVEGWHCAPAHVDWRQLQRKE